MSLSKPEYCCSVDTISIPVVNINVRVYWLPLLKFFFIVLSRDDKLKNNFCIKEIFFYILLFKRLYLG